MNNIMLLTKVCTICNKEKPLDGFYMADLVEKHYVKNVKKNIEGKIKNIFMIIIEIEI